MRFQIVIILFAGILIVVGAALMVAGELRKNTTINAFGELLCILAVVALAVGFMGLAI